MTNNSATTETFDILGLEMDGPALQSRKIKRREWLVDLFLRAKTLTMVFGQRGVGKTFFLLWLALALARGVQFLSWTVKKPRRVLYIEGEMSNEELQERL